MSATTLQHWAHCLLDRSKVIESQLIASGWCQPEALHSAAVGHELCGNSFSDPTSRFMFTYLIECAERGIKPDVGEAVAMSVEGGADVATEIELLDLLLAPDYIAAQFDDYAYGVALLSQRRERAQALLREAAGLIAGDEFLVTVQPKRSGSLRVKVVA